MAESFSAWIFSYSAFILATSASFAASTFSYSPFILAISASFRASSFSYFSFIACSYSGVGSELGAAVGGEDGAAAPDDTLGVKASGVEP